MESLEIQIDPFPFLSRLEVELAPKTFEAFRRLLSFENHRK
jgi:hypothetical protein